MLDAHVAITDKDFELYQCQTKFPFARFLPWRMADIPWAAPRYCLSCHSYMSGHGERQRREVRRPLLISSLQTLPERNVQTLLNGS